LQMDQRNDVARIQVLELTEQLLSQALGLSLTEQALDVLVREGFDPLYGARPMRRVIQKRLEHPLAGLFSLVTTLLLMRVMKV
jgi:ATP-dependent Clp protease ATP-binding subunit ClpA